ncbi:hypothetical protein TELCIR_21632, partial [Teladorsagia circumcincta]
NMASHKDFHHDNAPRHLFTSVDRDAISGATFKAFDNLLSFYNEPDADVQELVTSDWLFAIDAFLDAVTITPVMKRAQQYLTSQGHE